jgi:type IV pilus assembly protein PilQ
VPVVPISVQTEPHSALTIQEVSSGASYIEILANQPIGDYKATRISSPDRLIIDIAGAKIKQKPKSILFNKFGITKARIGVSPKNIRIVLDSGRVGFPAHTITNTEGRLRINFK